MLTSCLLVQLPLAPTIKMWINLNKSIEEKLYYPGHFDSSFLVVTDVLFHKPYHTRMIRIMSRCCRNPISTKTVDDKGPIMIQRE